ANRRQLAGQSALRQQPPNVLREHVRLLNEQVPVDIRGIAPERRNPSLVNQGCQVDVWEGFDDATLGDRLRVSSGTYLNRAEHRLREARRVGVKILTYRYACLPGLAA